MERAEGLLGLGEPKPPSKFWVAYCALLSAASLGLFFWALLSGAFLPGADGLGAPFVALWAAADTDGSLLNARGGGATLGRGLRIVGYGVFLFLAMGFYPATLWLTAPASILFVRALFVWSIVARWAACLAGRR